MAARSTAAPRFTSISNSKPREGTEPPKAWINNAGFPVVSPEKDSARQLAALSKPIDFSVQASLAAPPRGIVGSDRSTASRVSAFVNDATNDSVTAFVSGA